MKVGIGSYTFPWHIGVASAPPEKPWDVFDLIQAGRELGAEVVQFCENLSLTELDDCQLDEVLDAAAEANLILEVGTRGIDPHELSRCAAIARRAGSSFVRLVIDNGGDEPSAPDAIRRLEAVMPVFREMGIVLAIENHDRFSCEALAEMVERLQPSAGIVLDTANSLGGLEGLETVLECLGPLTVNVHIKDVVATRLPHMMGFKVRGVPAGTGQIDIPTVLTSIAGTGNEPTVILEQWTDHVPGQPAPLTQEMEAVRIGFPYLREQVRALEL